MVTLAQVEAVLTHPWPQPLGFQILDTRLKNIVLTYVKQSLAISLYFAMVTLKSLSGMGFQCGRGKYSELHGQLGCEKNKSLIDI